MPSQLLYNEKLAKLIIVGNLSVDFPSTCISDLDSSIVKIANPLSSQYFGFSEEEIEDLMLKKLSLDSKIHKRCLEFYLGFSFCGKKYASPFSVISYIHEC